MSVLMSQSVPTKPNSSWVLFNLYHQSLHKENFGLFHTGWKQVCFVGFLEFVRIKTWIEIRRLKTSLLYSISWLLNTHNSTMFTNSPRSLAPWTTMKGDLFKCFDFFCVNRFWILRAFRFIYVSFLLYLKVSIQSDIYGIGC